MTISTAVALALAFLSTTITNLAYLREHEAAAALPVLSMRRPVRSLQLLIGDRSWLLGFAIETAGFGGLRVLAFAGVTAGAFLLARPETRAANAER